MAPAARREEILEAPAGCTPNAATRRYRPSDVARHAGPASYIGGERGLFITLVERLGPQIIEVIRLGTSRTVRVRARSLAKLVARLDRREPADLAGDGRPE